MAGFIWAAKWYMEVEYLLGILGGAGSGRIAGNYSCICIPHNETDISFSFDHLS